MRRLTLEIGGLVVTEAFKVDFDITSTLSQQIDWNKVTIWNLSPGTEGIISNNDFVRLSAGLNDNFGIISRGFVDRWSKYRKGPNRLMEVIFSHESQEDKDVEPVDFFTDEENVPAKTVFENYANRFNKPRIDYVDLIPERYTYIRFFQGYGKIDPRIGMTNALNRVRVLSGGTVDLVFKIEIDRIVVLDRNRARQGNIVFLSESQGLIGTPKSISLGPDSDGLEIETVVDPRIKIDSYIQLQSRFATSGTYKVQELNHYGSSIDGVFRTKVVGIAAE